MSDTMSSMTLMSVGVCSLLVGICLGRYTRSLTTRAIPSLMNRANYKPHQMVLIVRKDLKMDKGKQAAQCSHATLGAYRRAQQHCPESLWAWETFGQAKIVLQVPNEEDMLSLARDARQANLSTYIVRDAGRTQVAAGSKTVLAIGPADKQQVDAITRHLKLL